MDHPPELLKSFVNRLAEMALSDDGTHLTRLLRVTGLLGQPSRHTHDQSLTDNIGQRAPQDEAADSQPHAGRVGIWERKQEGGKTYFVRSKEMWKDWNFWANVGRIEPKGAKRRVVLIGESVARGYLYDPQFTPAMVLETMLESQLGKGKVEVIDLARTNLGLDVREVITSALMLEPEAVLVFSGNNWTARFPPAPEEVAYIDTILREQGIPGLKRYAEDQLANDVRSLVSDVDALYKARGIPLIWLVPEFNLGDWRDPVTNAPHLPEGLNREWLAHSQTARQALAAGDLQRAAEAAEKMVELDGGISVAGLYILAECRQRTGDAEGTRRYLELARDAVLWDPSRNISPRMYRVAQDTLRQEAQQHHQLVVDLPAIYQQYLTDGLPDRRLFLDYCHLTSEGIQVTMAAAASTTLDALKGAEIPWRSLLGEWVPPSREIEAEAAFLAAVHNAHWWQSYDLVEHYCMRAVQALPEIAQVMTRFLDIQTRRAPMLMCKSAEQIAELGSPLIQHYLLRYNHQQLDVLLLDAVVSSLKRAGIDAGERLAQLRRGEHSVVHHETNLLDYYYNSAALQPQEVMWSLPRPGENMRRKVSHYYKAYWPESKFIFVGDAGRAVRLRLTCRLSRPPATDGGLCLEVNGHCQGEVPVSGEWSSWELPIAGETVRDGLNEISIRWPMPVFPGQDALSSFIDELAEGAFPEFFTVFGEIHTFTATDEQAAHMEI